MEFATNGVKIVFARKIQVHGDAVIDDEAGEDEDGKTFFLHLSHSHFEDEI